jgi:26S proteasome regulatory subunit N3
MTAAAAEIDDIEMASETEEKEAEEKKEGEKKDPNLLSVEDIREHCKLIKRSVETKEPRFVLRVLRSLPATRKKTNAIVLRTIVKGFFTCNEQEKEKLLEYVENAAELEGVPQLLRGKNASTPLIPEVDSYLSLLVLIHLIDNKKANMAVDCAAHLMTKLESQNRRTMDMISSKCYFYYVRSYEMVGRLAETRDVLHSRLRTATLRNDFEGQAVLINCLLRNYLHYNLYNQADKLVLKSTFPEQASNNEWARYYYYLGRIKATQLDYSVAHKHLLQSSRKAPQNSAAGFRQHVAKLSVTVELLLGNIPER